MNCPRCQHEHPAGQKFCGECGAPLQHSTGRAQSTPSYADMQRSLTESLEQQTATAEILRVISSSRTDAQPVFQAIASRAVHLCDALFSTVYRYDGTLIHHVADNYPTPEMRAILTEGYPSTVERDSATALAIRERRIVQIEDVLGDTTPAASRAIAGGRLWVESQVGSGSTFTFTIPTHRGGDPREPR